MGLERFLLAHDENYEDALAELTAGQKESHWMWYIFPQIKGLGFSYMAEYYAISGLSEAKLYMQHPILREHMIELCNVLLSLEGNDALAVMGYPDNLKLQSSMTLFCVSNPEYDIFQLVLDKYFKGNKDENTLYLLQQK